MKTIAICSSASFYRQAIEVKSRLEKFGLSVIVPKVALQMEQSGDFDVSHYKTWFADANDYAKKSDFIRSHFMEIAKADAVLVLNYEKHGQANYIGGNVLMEMAVAFYLNKAIFILNLIPENSSFLEELHGMLPTVLNGDLEDLPKMLQ